MSTTNTVKNWSHPFKPSSGNLDPLQTLTAMAKASSGFYPIGKNGQWHGGIHFDANTARVFDQSSVRCIADGEVIAYRIDSTYPKSTYQGNPNAPFSTGFVLVKHKLEAPALPGREETPPALTFYSLYMHLLDWSSYGKPGAPTPPEFISETLYKVKPDKATDPLVGLRVRSEPGSTVLAILPKGSKVKVGEAHSVKPKWRKLISILQGRALPAISGPNLGWVFIEEMQPTSESDQFLVGELANDPEPSLAPEKGLNVRKAGRHGTPKIGLIPQGAAFSLEPGTGDYRKLKSIVEGLDIAPLSANSVCNIQGYVHLGSLQATRATPKLDQVHILANPHSINAGDLIGHIGLYQNHDDASPQHMLHLEVFSCEDVPSFISKSRAWAARLPAEQKSLLKVYKGASKLIPHREGISASNPPMLSDTGTMAGIDLIIPQSLLDVLPADRKLQVSTPIPGSSTPRVTHWWRLDNLLADASGNPISGWLAEQEGITTRHSPWEWVGFDFIQETGRPIGKTAYFFEAMRRLTGEEQANYRALISQEDQGPVRTRLYDIIDSNRDNKLTADEIRAALERPWHAQSIAQLITRYESEWLLNKEKWDELDPLMRHVPPIHSNQNWVNEKQRIEKLSWWDKLAGKHGISAGRKSWHINPISMLTVYGSKHELINIDKFIDIYTPLHPSFDNTTSLGSTAKENLKELLKNINKYYSEHSEKPNRYELAYMLATARHEMYHFPTGEYFSKKPEVGEYHYFDKYDPVLASTPQKRQNAIDHENTVEGDGFKYRGRGPVHLTWKVNYRKAMEKFGPDFVNNPDLAADFENSVPIMIWGMKTGMFTGKSIGDYINSTTVDYEGARRVINGVDQKVRIASYAKKFENILEESSTTPTEF